MTPEMTPIFIGLFALVITGSLFLVGIFIWAIVMFVKAIRTKQDLLRHLNVAEIIFDCPVGRAGASFGNPGQTCYVIHGLSDENVAIRDRVIVAEAKPLLIDVEHYQRQIGQNLARSMARGTVKIDLQRETTYFVRCNHLEGTFEVTSRQG